MEARKAIIIEVDYRGEKTAYNAYYATGEGLFAGLCSKRRYKDVYNKIKQDFPGYIVQEFSTKIKQI